MIYGTGLSTYSVLGTSTILSTNLSTGTSRIISIGFSTTRLKLKKKIITQLVYVKLFQ